ncbi:glycosyltransferase family 4 protein [Candidatus Neomarinimicrobiota bacterium]
MRIAIFNSLYYPDIKGGAEISVKVLAESLQELGHEVFVICSSDRARRRNIQGVKVFYLPSFNLYSFMDSRKKLLFLRVIWQLLDFFNVFMLIAIWRIVRRLKPDVLHSNNLAGLSIAPWLVGKVFKIPMVHTLRDYQLLCIMGGGMFRNGKPCNHQCLGCKLLTYPKRQLSKEIDYVIGNSQFVLDRHLRHGEFPEAKTSVIYNCYENNHRISSDAKSDKMRFGFIGRLDPVKGVDLLIDAFRRADIADAAELIIAGYGPDTYVRALRQKAADIPVEFLGVVEPAKFFSEVDVVIVPSLWEEPLSRVIFEAYAHGKPVLGSLRGGTPEILVEHKTGFLFNTDTPAELSGLLKRLTNNQAVMGDMSVQCLNESKKFLPGKVVKEYLDTYQSVLDSARARPIRA